MIPDQRYRILSDTALFAASGKLPDTIEKLLFSRGIDTPEKIERFLHPDPCHLHVPMSLPDMEKAVFRIRSAIEKGEAITVYGDYDADGVTATALVVRYLSKKGAKVDFYIPDREKEGYGMHADALKSLGKRGTALIVTVDTGTTAIEEIALAAELGIDVVVTDHHTCARQLPDAVAVVNPTRPDSRYPFTGLAGVGVAFKLCCAIEGALCGGDLVTLQDDMLTRYGDLVTLGTVADVMPLLDENRYIVKKGLGVIEKTENKGILALLDASFDGKSRKMTTQSVGFAIAPKINVAGRMAHAELALQLFLTEDSTKAQQIAARLLELNKERQTIENEIVTLATKQIHSADLSEDAVLVLGDEGWHPGVIGIAAARIAERYGKPTFLVSFDGENGKGSVRSSGDFDVMDALCSVQDLLTKFGGHASAAGISVQKENFSLLRRRLNQYAAEHLTEEEKNPPLATADCEIGILDTCLQFVLALEELAPFGSGNEQPVFLLRNCKIDELIPLSGGKHTKMLVSREGIQLKVLLFGKSVWQLGAAVGDHIDLFGCPERNTFGGITTVQMSVKKFFLSYDVYSRWEQEKKRFFDIMSGEEEMHDFPQRTDFAAVYRFLSHCPHSEISYRFALSHFPPLSYPALRMILEVFSQAKLVQYHPDRAGETFRFSVLQVQEKVNIEATPIYRRYNPRLFDAF